MDLRIRIKLCEKKIIALYVYVLNLVESRPESMSMSEYSTLSQTGRCYYRSNRNIAVPVETLIDGCAFNALSNGKRKSHRDPGASPGLMRSSFLCVPQCSREWRWDTMRVSSSLYIHICVWSDYRRNTSWFMQLRHFAFVVAILME